jgi:hypothetical protein
MNKNFKHLLSTVLASLFYFIFRKDEPIEIPNLITTKCIELDCDNFSNLLTGEWIVVTAKNGCKAPLPFEINQENLAILNVNSMKTAELAARLGITNSKETVRISNGEYVKKDKHFRIDRPVNYSEIIDFYVFYWALDIKKMLSSEEKIETILDESVGSFVHLIGEIFTVLI